MPSNTQFDPAGDGLGGNYLDHARRDYLAGEPATTVCQRYGMSLSSFRMHARAGGWRRIDQPIGDVAPERGEYHPDDDVSFADLAEEAFLNIRRALGTGRAGEAAGWMRVYDKLCDRARSQVMARLPDITPPRLESSREPLKLIAAEDIEINDSNALGADADAQPQNLDSLHPVFSESNPPDQPPVIARSGA